MFLQERCCKNLLAISVNRKIQWDLSGSKMVASKGFGLHWRYSVGVLSDVGPTYIPLFCSEMVCSLRACTTHEQGFHIELYDQMQ